MSKVILLTIFCLFHGGVALQGISDEIYAQFPPIRHLDRFDPCINRKGAAYCTAHLEIFVDQPNEIYDHMRNYSNSGARHFNYSTAVYGFCVTNRCKQFYTGDSDEELQTAMEKCLDDYFQREYSMRARLMKQTCYRNGESKHQANSLDQFAKVLLVAILAMVALGTVYDVVTKDKRRNGFLMCFSLPANWKALKAPWPQDPKMPQLIGVNAMRTILSFLVVVTHAGLNHFMLIENPKNIETILEGNDGQIFLHSHVHMQTIFFMSGMFLTYSLQRKIDNNQLNWRGLPKVIFMRWLRLVPMLFLSMLFTVTAMKFSPVGPMWQESVGKEIRDCQKNWLTALLLLNNYVDDSQCALHHWSTFADFQLHILGLSIMYLLRSEAARFFAIGSMFVLGVILPAVETYTRDLDGAFLVLGPTSCEPGGFLENPTFVNLYWRTHTNMPCFFMGMALGIYLYKAFQKPVDTEKYKKYTVLYWLLLPVLLFLSYSNKYLYVRSERAPMSLRLVYALLQKPAWGLVITGFILGLVYRVEKVPLYSRVLEWPSWVPIARLTYSIYNTHMFIIRYLGGVESSLIFASDFRMLLSHFGNISLSVAVATFIWLFVEAPTTNLLMYTFSDKKSVKPVEPKKAD